MLRNTLSVMCANFLDDGAEKEGLALGKVWEDSGFLKSSWNLWIFSPKMYLKIPMPTLIHNLCYCFEYLSLSHRQHRNMFYKKIISLNIVIVISFFFWLLGHSTPILTPGIAQAYYSPWKPQISGVCSQPPPRQLGHRLLEDVTSSVQQSGIVHLRGRNSSKWVQFQWLWQPW